MGISDIRKDQLKKQYFNKTIDVNSLTQDEYNYYDRSLLPVKERSKKASILYFNNATSFVLTKGKGVISFNKQDEAVKKDYSIEVLDVFSLGDFVINSEFSNEDIYTNIRQNTSLHQLLLKEVNSVAKLNQLSTDRFLTYYQDLCGYIQLKGFSSIFATERAALTYRDSLLNIDTQSKFYPPEVVAITYLFSLL